jgi:hypothetical protein
MTLIVLFRKELRVRKQLSIIFGALCGVALALPAGAQTETVTGVVVDLSCYMLNKANTGLNHVRSARESQTGGSNCAVACAKWDGQPTGLVTSDGKVYQFAGPLVEGNNIKVVPHLTHTVTVTGTVKVVNGLPMLTASDLKMVSAGPAK